MMANKFLKPLKITFCKIAFLYIIMSLFYGLMLPDLPLREAQAPLQQCEAHIYSLV